MRRNAMQLTYTVCRRPFALARLFVEVQPLLSPMLALQDLFTMQAFDPADRPTCQEALSDPYFHGLAQPQREPAAQPVSKLAFEFEKRKLHTTEVRRLCSQGADGGRQLGCGSDTCRPIRGRSVLH